MVIFVNAPNTDDILVDGDNSLQAVTKGMQHTDWANFPHLGILSLASHTQACGFESVYFDGVALDLSVLLGFIEKESSRILALCCSSITANFGASEYISRFTKGVDPRITTIFGNDHFSVMRDKIVSRYGSIDYGIVGNEVYGSLSTLLNSISVGSPVDDKLPGLVSKHSLEPVPTGDEDINPTIDYSLIDRHFKHSHIYNNNFQSRLTDRIYELTGRKVTSGVPVEIARGCIKFKGDDACSFCSIQYGGMWRNHLGHEKAWNTIKQAHDYGYDYLYVTADELPLTFARLLLDMAKNTPGWWLKTPVGSRPMLVGYARADGIQKKNVMSAMASIGFKILFVGIDAGAQKSLQALRKPLKSKNEIASSESMYESNLSAIENAKTYDIKIKAGFVLGHIGMNKQLLRENIEEYKNLLDLGKEVIISADVEMLSPEPGSKDYNFLTAPSVAELEAHKLNVSISSLETRDRIANYYRPKDIFDRESAISDYIKAMMPELERSDLAQARDEIRSFSREVGIVVGDDL
ncbi:B12-binding domain-containing radical SAM protein [Salinicola sp. V024]